MAPPVTTTGSSWVKTVGGTVTSCDYSGSQTTMYVWPTGYASRDITVVVYEGLTVINVTIINLDVVVLNGHTSTITVIKTNQPTYTPPPPPPQSTKSQITSTSTTSNSTSTHTTSTHTAITRTTSTSTTSTHTTSTRTTGISTTSTSTSTHTTSTHTTSTRTTSTSTTAKQTHTVQVGALGELIYGPNQLNAALGDIVRFDFLKLNHSVTQSSFAKPCTYNGGFDTGLNQFNPQNISGKFLVDFQVNTTDPLWFYW
jgi:hypothetical protein